MIKISKINANKKLYIKVGFKMEDFQNEVIGFIVVTLVVIMLAYYESKIRKKD